MPDEVVASAGIAVGVRLGRPLLRRLRTELRRAEARAVAGRALAARDLSAAHLLARLAEAGVPPLVASETVRALTRAGVVDDGRLARRRLEALAARGYGDAAIAADLEGQGIDRDVIRTALAELPPEEERAKRIAAREQGGVKTARRLARRGFRPEAIEEAVGALDADPRSGLG